MNAHPFLDDELRDQAALYVLGSMEEDMARGYRLHLPACEICRAEVHALGEITGDLVELAPAVEPPPTLYPRVLERVRSTNTTPRADAKSTSDSDDPSSGQVWKRWNDDAAARLPFAYLTRDETNFVETSIPGVRARKLFVDRETQRVTMLVRMDPGASYPAHRHTGPEDCYVLEGDLQTERNLRAGDFVRAAPGSVHTVQSTRGGCLLFIVSSLGDEIVA